MTIYMRFLRIRHVVRCASCMSNRNGNSVPAKRAREGGSQSALSGLIIVPSNTAIRKSLLKLTIIDVRLKSNYFTY